MTKKRKGEGRQEYRMVRLKLKFKINSKEKESLFPHVTAPFSDNKKVRYLHYQPKSLSKKENGRHKFRNFNDGK